MKRLLGNRGSNIVEMALVLGVLMLCLFAIFDLGRAVYEYADIGYAAQRAARYAIVHPSSITDIKAQAINSSSLGLQTSDITVTFLDSSPSAVRVDVQHNYQAVSLLIANLAGGSTGINLHASSTMYLE